MKIVQMIGAVEKTDLTLYLSKVLRAADQKVLLVDGTLRKDLQYAINNFGVEQSFIEFEGFDITFHYQDFTGVLAELDDLNKQYDILIVDSDDPAFFTYEQYKSADMRVIVTTLERSSVERTNEIITRIYSSGENTGHVEVERIIIGSVDCGIDEQYLNMQLSQYFIIWPEESYHLPVDEVNYAIKIENQHNKRINMKKISKSYKQLLEILMEQILECDTKTAKTAVKVAQRRV
ncbi:hypothetical protein YDYSY3_39560 [Paenibacillus chitinolyticus]|uniref:hypothetical protein n=1 Tax=Paenibacillus chitinolyticus TaxID=79263 RepID=UPI0026E49856|nr:hypothetical protein [Paenibacillus chitinolyticus]GKS12956.1 hypothetical protein YDYSY3_39560 [Paenibacillus chitinolyticus]